MKLARLTKWLFGRLNRHLDVIQRHKLSETKPIGGRTPKVVTFNLFSTDRGHFDIPHTVALCLSPNPRRMRQDVQYGVGYIRTKAEALYRVVWSTPPPPGTYYKNTLNNTWMMRGNSEERISCIFTNFSSFDIFMHSTEILYRNKFQVFLHNFV